MSHITPDSTQSVAQVSELPGKAEFPWYLASSSAWLGAMSLQGFLVTWLLVGTLETPADKVGFIRSLLELPAILVLVGGVFADRMDPRKLLQRAHIAIAIPPLLVALAYLSGKLDLWVVVAFGMAMVTLQSLSDPARQTMLNRITRIDIQRTVTLTTIVTSTVGILAMWIGGKLESIGLSAILLIQSSFFLLGLLAIMRLSPVPRQSEVKRINLIQGFRAALSFKLVRNLIGLNFASSLFNAGAYIIAIPFIVKDVYSGDAAFYANVIIVFTCGGVASNLILFRFMPLLKPGRLFLILQLSRALILGLILTEPTLPLFYLGIFAWGLNMGGTTTMARAIVQESAPENKRGQILSILTFSFMVSAFISAPVLGIIVAAFSPLAALVPGVLVSLFIFAVGTLWSGLWQYQSTTASPSSTN